MINNSEKKCKNIMEIVDESEKQGIFQSLLRLRASFHLFLCPDCSEKRKKMCFIREIMKTDFLPPQPNLDEVIWMSLRNDFPLEKKYIDEKMRVPSVFSFKTWVLIGLFVLFSLSSSFFGLDFIEIARTEGLSFVLPVGITIGMIVSCYGALLIGSHLNELSSRFKLR